MGLLESATTAGELVSLALIAGILAVLIISSYKTKTYRSLQFQMLLFAIVLFAAEIPRVLSTLGVLDIAGLEDIGLELHSVSMVILVLFMAYRIRSFMRSD